MKITNILLFLFLPIFIISCTENNPDQPRQSEKPVEETETLPALVLADSLNQYFSALTELGKFNGVIYAAKNGEQIISKAYNIDQRPDSSAFVSTTSQFDIHSVSKLMAQYLVVKLEQEKMLDRHDLLESYIPGFPYGDKITIKMLLNHSSGLPRELALSQGNRLDLSADQILEASKLQELLFEPGTDQQYSNVAYEIIYEILARTSGKSFAQYLTDEIFVPLKMNHSGAHFYTKQSNLQQLAKNHEKDDDQIVQIPNILGDETKTARIFSTAADLSIFLDHIRQQPYANLLKIKDDVIEKNGGGDGVRAQIYTNLKLGYMFVLLCNYDEIPFEQTIGDFIKILEGKPYTVPKALSREAINVPAQALEKFVGAYTFADFNNMELIFKIEKGQLVVYQGVEGTELSAETENIFFYDPQEPESFEFVRNESGSHDALMGWKGIKLKGVKVD